MNFYVDVKRNLSILFRDKKIQASLEFVFWFLLLYALFVFVSNAPYDNFLYRLFKLGRLREDVFLGVIFIIFCLAPYFVGELFLHRRLMVQEKRKRSYILFCFITVSLAVLSAVGLVTTQPTTSDYIAQLMALVFLPIIFGTASIVYCGVRMLILSVSLEFTKSRGYGGNPTFPVLLYKIRKIIRILSVVVFLIGVSLFVYDYRTIGLRFHFSKQDNSLAIAYKALEIDNIEYCKYADKPQNKFCNFSEVLFNNCDRTWYGINQICFPTFIGNKINRDGIDGIIKDLKSYEEYKNKTCNSMISDELLEACKQIVSSLITTESEVYLKSKLQGIDVKAHKPKFIARRWAYSLPNSVAEYSFYTQGIFSSEDDRYSPDEKDYFVFERGVLARVKPNIMNILDEETKNIFQDYGMKIEFRARTTKNSWYLRIIVLSEDMYRLGADNFIDLFLNKIKPKVDLIEDSYIPESRTEKDVQRGGGYYCLDSDGGEDFYVKGKTCSNLNDNGIEECFEDECKGEGARQVVIEQYCLNNKIEDIVHSCLNGCKNGACLGLSN